MTLTRYQLRASLPVLAPKRNGSPYAKIILYSVTNPAPLYQGPSLGPFKQNSSLVVNGVLTHPRNSSALLITHVGMIAANLRIDCQRSSPHTKLITNTATGLRSCLLPHCCRREFHVDSHASADTL